MGIRHAKLADATAIVTGDDWDAPHTLDGLLGLFLDAIATPSTFLFVTPDGKAGQSAISTPARTMLAAATFDLMRAALAAAPLDSAPLTGTPTAPTAPLGTSTNQIATMAAIKAAIDALVNASPGTLDTLKELADAIGDDPNFAATMSAALGNRLRIDAAQSLTTLQQARGLANLGIALGVLANNVVQLDGNAKLPAVDGSALLNLVWSQIGGKPNFAAVATSGSYADLSSKPALGTAAALDVGTAASKVVQLDASAKLPAVDGSALTNVPAVVPRSTTSIVSNVALPAAGNYGDILTLSLAAGTYLVLACSVAQSSASASTFTAKVWDGGSNVVCSASANSTQANSPTSLASHGIVTLAAPTTLKLSVTDHSTNSGLAVAAYGAAKTTTLTAIKLA